MQARSLPSDGSSASTLSGKHLHVQPTTAEELRDAAQRSQVVAAQKGEQGNAAMSLLVCSPLKLPYISCLNLKLLKSTKAKKVLPLSSV